MALVKNIPFIQTTPIPTCETKNARFFDSHGMSYAFKSVTEQVSYSTLLFKNESARSAMLQAQRENAFPNAAEDIYQLLVNMTEVNYELLYFYPAGLLFRQCDVQSDISIYLILKRYYTAFQ